MLDEVRRAFNRLARNTGQSGYYGIVKTIRMPERLYGEFLQLHFHTCALIDRLEEVLEDGEHQLLIEEGRQHGLRMPDAEGFLLRIAASRAQTDSYDPGYCVRDGGDIILPIHVARGLFGTAMMGMSLVHDSFQAILTTDYARYLRTLRNNGCAYAGPEALTQMYTLHIALQIAAALTEEKALPDHLPCNWTRDRRSMAAAHQP